MNRATLLLGVPLFTLAACTTQRKAMTSTTEPYHITPGIYHDGLRDPSTFSRSYTSFEKRTEYGEARLYCDSTGKRKRNWHRPSTLPPFVILSKNGDRITNETLLGRITVINFWQEMCPPCMKEIPWLCSLRDTFPEANFIAISVEDEKTATEIFNKRHFNWAHVVADSTFTSWLPSETWYPTTIVVDQNGYIRTFNVGFSRRQQKRILDTLRAVQANGPLDAPRYYKDLHYEEEYYTP